MPDFATVLPIILLVDDERETCEEIAEFLSGRNLPCRIANSVDEALQTLAGQPDIRVVVTDLRMPHRSGFDLLEAIAAVTGGGNPPRVIVMTGHADQQGAEYAAVGGAWGFLAKPLDPHAVEMLVRAALDDAPAEGLGDGPGEGPGDGPGAGPGDETP